MNFVKFSLGFQDASNFWFRFCVPCVPFCEHETTSRHTILCLLCYETKY